MVCAVRSLFGALMIAIAGVAALPSPVLAHHGQASYEPGKTLTLRGTVTEWTWANPHCYLRMEVKDAAGTPTLWVLETQNPVSMSKGGWTRRSMVPGDLVTVTFQPVRSGAPLGLIRTVMLASGQTLGASGDAPRTPER
jgi:hypothetical protein